MPKSFVVLIKTIRQVPLWMSHEVFKLNYYQLCYTHRNSFQLINDFRFYRCELCETKTRVTGNKIRGMLMHSLLYVASSGWEIFGGEPIQPQNIWRCSPNFKKNISYTQCEVNPTLIFNLIKKRNIIYIFTFYYWKICEYIDILCKH